MNTIDCQENAVVRFFLLNQALAPANLAYVLRAGLILGQPKTLRQSGDLRIGYPDITLFRPSAALAALDTLKRQSIDVPLRFLFEKFHKAIIASRAGFWQMVNL